MFEATNHIAHGHKNCLCLSNKIYDMRERFEGYKALFENNIEANENYIFDLKV